MMALEEIIRGLQTSEATHDAVHALATRLGKSPISVRNAPGFVVNRVLIPYLMGAVQLFEAGHDAQMIDDAMLDFGMPMGPMRLLDEIGLDVAAHVARTLQVSSDVLTAMVAAGWLGKKGGKGFYLHGSGKTRVNSGTLALRNPHGVLMTGAQVQDHLSGLLSSEAARCLKEGVAASAADIDLAMVLGTGYAPFRGGPLAHSLTLSHVATTAEPNAMPG